MLTELQQKKLIVHLQRQVAELTRLLRKEKMMNKDLTHKLMSAKK